MEAGRGSHRVLCKGGETGDCVVDPKDAIVEVEHDVGGAWSWKWEGQGGRRGWVEEFCLFGAFSAALPVWQPEL